MHDIFIKIILFFLLTLITYIDFIKTKIGFLILNIF